MSNMFNKLTKNFDFFESDFFTSEYKNDIINNIKYVEKFNDYDNSVDYYGSCIKKISDILELIIYDFLKNKLEKNVDGKNFFDLINILEESSNLKDSKYLFAMMHEIRHARNHETHKLKSSFKVKHNKIDVLQKLKRFFDIYTTLYKDELLRYKKQHNNDEIEFDLKVYPIVEDNIEPISEIERNKQLKNTSCYETIKINKDAISNWLCIQHAKLIVPIYQRKYSWEKGNVLTLLDDIKKRINDNNDHYFGVIAQKKKCADNNNEPNIIKIIDGQQRLTTSLLLIVAVVHILINDYKLKENEIDWYQDMLKNLYDKNKNLGNYIYNPGGTEEENRIFKKILNLNFDFDEIKNSKSKYANNYIVIYDYLKDKEKFKNSNDIMNFIWVFLNKFYVGTISFDEKEYSNKKEMEVFENLNSKGLELSFIDLIKNHIFNYCDDNTLNDYDKEIPQEYNLAIAKFEKDKDIESFYSTLSELQLGKELKEDNKLKFISARKSLDEFLKDFNNIDNLEKYKEIIKYINKYIEVYLEIISKNKEKNFLKYLKCENIIEIINEKKKKRNFAYYAFIIYKILNENGLFISTKKNQPLNKNQIKKIQEVFLEIAKFLIKTKVITKQGDSNIKRELMEIANKSLKFYNNEFNKKDSENIDKVLNNVCDFILEELNRINNIYTFNDFKVCLENNNNHNQIIDLLLLTEKIMSNSLYDGESIKRENISIEHIMPEKNEQWINELQSNEEKNEFKEKFDSYLNKLGNYLVLTRQSNSKSSNNTFNEKKKKVYKDLISPLYKNDDFSIDISRKEKWTFEDIEKRTKSLIEYITKNVITK